MRALSISVSVYMKDWQKVTGRMFVAHIQRKRPVFKEVASVC